MKETDKSQQRTCGMSLEGKFWIDPDGTVHPVEIGSSHEEWAFENCEKDLEALLAEGWIRVQAFPGKYLLVDHARASVVGKQEQTLASFFVISVGEPTLYPRIVVQRHLPGGDDEREFPNGDNLAALAFACGR